jgi:oligosaccharide repeat unit polymerase
MRSDTIGKAGEGMPTRTRSGWTEDRLLRWGVLLVVAVLIAQGEGPFVPIVFGGSLFWFLYQKKRLGECLRFNNLTLPSFFMFVYLVVVPFGAITMFRQMNTSIRYSYLLAMQSVFVTFPYGVGLANWVSNSSPQVIRNYMRSQIEVTDMDLKFMSIFKVMLLAAFPIVFLYILRAPYVQLLEVVRAYPTGIDPGFLRNAGNDDIPRAVQYAFEILRRFMLPLCTLYAYFRMSFAPQSRWRYVFPVLFVSTLFVSALTLDRAPPLGFVVMFILAYLLRHGKGLLGGLFTSRTIALFITAMIIGGIISVLQYQSEFSLQLAAANAWYVFSYRILQDAPYMASIAFETFHDSSTFLYGSSMRILSVLPGFHYAQSDSSIYSPAAPVGFVADLWRNFGWPGVIGGTILIGFAYQTIQLKLFRKKKSILMASLTVILLVGCIWIIHGNVLGIMSTSVLLLGVLFSVLYSKSRTPPLGGQPQVELRRQA